MVMMVGRLTTRRWFGPMVFIIVSIVSTVAVECGLRIVAGNSLFLVIDRLRDPQYAARLDLQVRSAHPVYHHGLQPMKSQTLLWGPYRYLMQTNSLGLKDGSCREVSLDVDHRRILFIGDSFTEGIGFPYKDTFVGMVDAALRTEGIEVLNAGVSSYSPTLYHAKCRHLIETVGLKVDHVVVYLDISDIQDEAWRDADPAILDADAMSKDAEHRAGWTLKSPMPAYAQRGLEIADRQMQLLWEFLQERGIRMTLAVYPWPIHIDANDRDGFHPHYWRQWAAQREVGFISHFDDFVNGDPQDVIARYFIAGDDHWNKAGHALIAHRLLAELDVRW